MGWMRLLSGKIQVDYMRQRLCSRMEVSWLLFGSFFRLGWWEGSLFLYRTCLVHFIYKVVPMIQTILRWNSWTEAKFRVKSEFHSHCTVLNLIDHIQTYIICIHIIAYAHIHLINAMQWTFNSLFRLERDTASSKAWFKSLTTMSWQSPRGALSMGNHDGHDMNTGCLRCILKTPSTFFKREVMSGIDWVFLHSIGQWLRIIFVGTFSPILGEDFAFHVSFSVANRQIENDQTALKLVWGVTSVLVWPQAAYLHFGVWGLASWKKGVFWWIRRKTS